MPSTQFWSRWRVGTRLLAAFAFVVAMMIVVVSYGGSEFFRMRQALTLVTQVHSAKLELAYQMLIDMNQMSLRANSIALLTDGDLIKADGAELDRAIVHYEQAATRLAASDMSDGESGRLARIAELAKKTVPAIREAALQGQKGANVEAAALLTSVVRPNETKWRAEVEAYVLDRRQSSEQAYTGAIASQRRAVQVAVVLVLTAILASICLALAITRSVTAPLKVAMKLAQRIASGDLSVKVDRTAPDELGRLLDAMAEMRDKLKSIVGGIRESAEGVGSASSEVASGNEDLSARTESAASQLQETASSLGQLTASVRKGAQAAAEADTLSMHASSKAVEGSGAVHAVVDTMKAIDANSRRISEITGVIDGIAFQTNILALNAAVEAARAGEQGRGFAVVASEVRVLAQRAASAAKDIRQLVVTSAVDVERGSTLASRAGQVIGDIVAGCENVSRHIREVSSSTAAQHVDIGRVSSAVQRLDDMTQQNAALVEQSAAAARALQQQSTALGDVVRTFRIEEPAIEANRLGLVAA